ncbi:MAG: hypothetical protein F6J87_23725 [Spirulina sp. SIO3F2]|nr:hypothetical protein [Spirulina sp. SIO3F2]
MSVQTSTHTTTTTSAQPAIAVCAALAMFAVGYSAACAYLTSATKVSTGATIDHAPVVLHQAAGWNFTGE